MVIVAVPTVTLYNDFVVLVAQNVNPTIEDLPTQRRFYPFDLVISEAFTSANNTVKLAISDEAEPYTDSYPLVDRLNKNVTGEELIAYAGKRRCIRCIYDNLFKIVRVVGCICPVTLSVPTGG